MNKFICMAVILMTISFMAFGTARLEPDWHNVKIKTSMGDRLEVINTEEGNFIGIEINGREFSVNRSLPNVGLMIPGGISIETESVEMAAGKYEIWRVVRLVVFDDKSGKNQEIEYHFSPTVGFCGYKLYDVNRNLLEMEDFCKPATW